MFRAWKESDWFQRAIVGMLFLMLITVLVCVVIALYGVIDVAAMKNEVGVVTVADRGYKAAWTQTVIHSNGKFTWVQVIPHPDRWWLVVEFDNGEMGSVYVTQADWTAFPSGSKVEVVFCVGRFSGKRKVKTLFLKEGTVDG